MFMRNARLSPNCAQLQPRNGSVHSTAVRLAHTTHANEHILTQEFTTQNERFIGTAQLFTDGLNFVCIESNAVQSSKPTRSSLYLITALIRNVLNNCSSLCPFVLS
jgi:hypothetical protein